MDWTTVGVAAVGAAGSIGGAVAGYLGARANARALVRQAQAETDRVHAQLESETARLREQIAAESSNSRRSFREAQLEVRRQAYVELLQVVQEFREHLGLPGMTDAEFRERTRALSNAMMQVLVLAPVGVRDAANEMMRTLNIVWRSATDDKVDFTTERFRHAYIDNEPAVFEAWSELANLVHEDCSRLERELAEGG